MDNLNATLNYIGSKKSLLDFIDNVLIKVNQKLSKNKKDNITFFDGFAGTGIVGKYFNYKYNYINIANDLEYYSYIINYSNLKVNYTNKLKNHILELDKLTKPKNNLLITNNYSPAGELNRMFWTIENANKGDAIMEELNTLKINNNINNDEYLFLVSSLIISIDKVANTASVYEAYLKQFKKTAQNIFKLNPIHTNENINNIKNNKVYNLDINSDTILNNEYDIVYLDPPYNSRQYGSNYNCLNYIAKYDKDLEIYGKSGLIKNYNKSKYCSKTFARNTFEELIKNIKSKYILISYNNEGIINQTDFVNILKTKGKTTLYKKLYKKFKSSINQENENVYEYLYLCQVNKIGEYSEIIINNIIDV
jgi:adenine-specific DNA-methyltransferase